MGGSSWREVRSEGSSCRESIVYSETTHIFINTNMFMDALKV